MTDQNRKTLRSFYCRDYIWEIFEQMAREMGCSMDYLINESMRHYARSREYGAGPDAAAGYGAQEPYGADFQPVLGRSAPADPNVDRAAVGYGQPAPAMEHRTYERMPAVANSPRPPALAPAPTSAFQAPVPRPGGGPPPPPRPAGGPVLPPAQTWSGQPRPPGPPGPPTGAQPYAQAPPPVSGAYAQAQRPSLYLTFNNHRYVIDKEKFVIGRGSQETDLTIRDGNISRKHCMVIARNGQYYIKDLGSTNGIEYRGNRIESKKIEDGDIFYLCDYELRFAYQ